jgi:hypothetical protein
MIHTQTKATGAKNWFNSSFGESEIRVFTKFDCVTIWNFILDRTVGLIKDKFLLVLLKSEL